MDTHTHKGTISSTVGVVKRNFIAKLALESWGGLGVGWRGQGGAGGALREFQAGGINEIGSCV